MWYELFSAVLGLVLYLVFIFLVKSTGGENNLEVAARVLNPPGGRVSINLFGGGDSAAPQQPSHVRSNPKNSTSKENFFDQPGTSNKPLTPPRAAQQPRQSDPIRPQQPETKPSQSQQSVKKNISSTGTSNGQLTAGYLEPTISFLTKSRYVNHVHTPRENGTAPSQNEHSRPSTSGSCYCTSNQKCRFCSQQQQQPQGVQKAVKMVNEAGQSSGENKAVQRRTGRGRRPQQATRNPISGQGDFHEDDKKRSMKRPKTPTKKMDNEEYALMDPIGHRGDSDRPLYVGSGPHTPRDRARTPTRMTTSAYRNCIVGEGDLGPESTFNRPRRSKSCPRRVRDTINRNPITGRNRDGTETEDSQNTPPLGTATQRRHVYKRADSNPVTGTGQDLKSWDIQRNARPKTPRPHSVSNPLTGYNCNSYEFRPDYQHKSFKGSPRPSESGNPLTGDNCKCFDISLEQRSRMPSSAKNQVSNNSPFVRENYNNYNGYSGNQNDSSFTTAM